MVERSLNAWERRRGSATSRIYHLAMFLLTGLTIIGLLGCSGKHLDPPAAPRTIEQMVEQLDMVARHIDEWGAASVSAPLPTTSNETFRFDLDVSDSELFGSKRTQGAVLLAISKGLRIGVSASANVAPAAATATEVPALPEATAEESVGALRELANAYDAEIGLPPGYRGRIAASERAEIGLHEFLSDPKKLTHGEEILFLPFTVNCRPGWRTGGGDYVGQVDVRLSYVVADEVGASELQYDYDDAIYPRVVSVYPAFGTQELDLRFSHRQLFALALQLAIAGEIASAQGIINFAKRLEQEAETATGLSQVVSYSNAGRHFGYEFRPSFTSLRDPASKKSGAGYHLQATNFPAFALVSVNRTDFDFLLRERAVRQASDAAIRRDERKRKELERFGLDPSGSEPLELAIRRSRGPASPSSIEEGNRQMVERIIQSERERFRDRYSAGDRDAIEAVDKELAALRKLVRVRCEVTHIWKPRTSKAMRVTEADVRRLARVLSNEEPLEFDSFSIEGRWLRKRRAMLQAEALNLSPLIEFRPFVDEQTTAPFQVTDVQPRIGTVGRENAFIVSGQQFPDHLSVMLVRNDMRLEPKQLIRVSDMILLVIMPVIDEPLAGASFEVRAGNQQAFSPPLTIRPAAAAAETLDVIVTRGADPHSALKLTIPAAQSPETLQSLVEMLKAVASSNTAAGRPGQADVKIEVQATQPSP